MATALGKWEGKELEALLKAEMNCLLPLSPVDALRHLTI